MTAGTTAPPSAARDRILDTATRLFYARGLRAVGVDTIIAESGVAKATFYKHFPAKDDLIAAYLDQVDEMWSGQLHAAAEAAGAGTGGSARRACSTPSAPPVARTATAAAASSTPRPRSTPGTVAHDRTVAHKQKVLAWLRDLARRRGGDAPGPARAVARPAAGRRALQRCAGRRPGGRRGRPRHAPLASWSRPCRLRE